MSDRKAAFALALCMAAVIPLLTQGCGKPAETKQVGTLKQWIVGTWTRTDDPNSWIFNASGEFTTTGRLPIAGNYEVVEPHTIKILLSGAGAMTASMMLGLPLNENQNLDLVFVVKDGKMKPVGTESVLIKQ